MLDACLANVAADLSAGQTDRLRAAILDYTSTKIATATRPLELALRAGAIGTYEICLQSGETHASPRLLELFGFPTDHGSLTVEEWGQVIHRDDRDRVLGSIKNHYKFGASRQHDYRVVVRGEVRWLRSFDRVDRDMAGRAVFLFGAVQDVTPHKAYEDVLWRAANEDGLTGLANRKRFREVLEAMVSAGQRVGLLILDLDHLKQANDIWGHAAGDHLIRAAAERLHGVTPADAIAARLGGDEFALGAPCHDEAGLTAIGERVAAAVGAPCAFEGAMLDCGGSLGAALYPDHAANCEGLMRAADVALLVTKLSGRGHCRLWRPGDEAELARLTRAKPRLAVLAA